MGWCASKTSKEGSGSRDDAPYLTHILIIWELLPDHWGIIQEEEPDTPPVRLAHGESDFKHVRKHKNLYTLQLQFNFTPAAVKQSKFMYYMMAHTTFWAPINLHNKQ